MSAIGTVVAIFTCTLGVASAAAVKAPPPAPTTRPADVGGKYVPPAGTGPATIEGIKYKYVATREREGQIVAGYVKLKVGQTREDVRAALGPPDKANRQYGKEADAPFLGWSYTYRIKTRAGAPNENDVRVQVYFDPEGKLHWAYPNVPGLKEIGRPGRP